MSRRKRMIIVGLTALLTLGGLKAVTHHHRHGAMHHNWKQCHQKQLQHDVK